MTKKIVSFVLLAVIISCTSDFKSSIPDARVNYSCDLRQNPYYKIKTEGNFMNIEPENKYGYSYGYGGLVLGRCIYPDFPYYAFDAACPVEARKDVAVEVAETELGMAVCPVCGTKYDLNGGGFPIGVQGGEYLKRYKVIASGEILKVSN